MKAKISKEKFEQFKAYLGVVDNAKKVYREMKDVFYGKYNENEVRKISDAFEEMVKLTFDDFTLSSYGDENVFTLEKIVDYCALKNILIPVEAKVENYLAIRFSGKTFFFLAEYAELFEETDYDSLSIAEIQALLGGENALNTLPAEMNSLSVKSVTKQRSLLEEKEKELKKVKEDLSWNKNKELAELQEQIRAMEEKLRERKRELMADLDAKMQELNEKKNELEKQIYMLESQIYTIRSYSGETVELNVVRNGNPAPINTPIVLNQKIQYLDEDLARMVGIYQQEINREFHTFEDALKHRDDVVDTFCPQQRAITFFRLSRNTKYTHWDRDTGMYEIEELIHGKKMGFLLRNGEQLSIGWLDDKWGEEKYVSFANNVIYRPGEERYDNVDDYGKGNGSDSRESMLSRVFAISVIQGILDNGKLVEFPEKINIMQPSQYVIFNFADAWLMDDRFGDFAKLVSYLNRFTREKDTILLFSGIGYADNRSNGENCRTRDCEVSDGIHTLNLVQDGETYVSALKRWSRCGATANVRVYPEEFINLSYMNSVWLSYYIQTKKLGNYCKDYARMIPHFKRALEIIIRRETEEMILIKKYYPEIEKVNEWQILMSHWKIKNQIRIINDFQAKRFANYLEGGTYYEMKHMFESPISYDETLRDYLYNELYASTHRTTYTDGNGEFSYNSDYKQSRYNFYCNSRDDFDEKKDELLKKLAEREALEEKKLDGVRKCVSAFVKNHDLDIAKILSKFKGDEYLMHAIDFTTNELYFRTKDAMSEELKQFVLKGKWNDISEYQRTHSCGTDFWYLYYLDGLQERYDDILSALKKMAFKIWLLETKKI